MNQGSNSNGRAAPSPAARGGYDAYFDAGDAPSARGWTTGERAVGGAAPGTPTGAVARRDAESDVAQSDSLPRAPSHSDPDTAAVRSESASAHPAASPGEALPVRRVNLTPAPVVSPELLGEVSATTSIAPRSRRGVRGALNRVGFRFGPSPAELRKEDRRERVRRRLAHTYQIAVLSVKGGVGRTTTTAALGSMFAATRPDRVVAVDANPHFGDLAVRTRRHPYGLTLRDLAQTTERDTYTAVQAYASVNAADLAVLAGAWSTESNAPLSGAEFRTAADILRRHFSLLLIDCGAGILDSATITVLEHSDAAVIVTPATVSGVTGAAATLNWLSAHGFGHLVNRAVVAVVHQHPVKPAVAANAIAEVFAAVRRPTRVLPFDAHLADDGEVDLRLLAHETHSALEELAATLADEFPGFTVAGPDGSLL